MKLWIVLLLIAVLTSCGGLEPPPPEPAFTGLRGVVRYVGGAAAWPADSVVEVRVVMFREQPVKPEDVITAVLSGTARLTNPALPLRVDSSSYEIAEPAPPQEYKYVVVAMRTGPNVQLDWTMLAVYSITGDPLQPSPILIEQDKTTTVDFLVDFANLPPQPF
jgi:hypothetical protein